MASEAIEKVQKEPCHCVRCGECRGSGNIEVRIPSYSSEDLETCDGCGGSGIVQTCDRCQLLRDMDWDEAARSFPPGVTVLYENADAIKGLP